MWEYYESFNEILSLYFNIHHHSIFYITLLVVLTPWLVSVYFHNFLCMPKKLFNKTIGGKVVKNIILILETIVKLRDIKKYYKVLTLLVF